MIFGGEIEISSNITCFFVFAFCWWQIVEKITGFGAEMYGQKKQRRNSDKMCGREARIHHFKRLESV